MEKEFRWQRYLNKYGDLCDKHIKKIESLCSKMREDIIKIMDEFGSECITMDFDFYDKENNNKIHCNNIEIDYDSSIIDESSGLYVNLTYNEKSGKKINTRDELDEYSIDLHTKILMALENML